MDYFNYNGDWQCDERCRCGGRDASDVYEVCCGSRRPPGAALPAVWLCSLRPQTVSPGGTVTFDQHLLVAPHGHWVSWLEPDTLQLRSAGVYLVNFTFLGDAPGLTLALALDGEELPASRFCSGEGVLIAGQRMLSVSPRGSHPKLTLMNPDESRAAVSATGGVVATLTLQKFF